MAYRRSASRSRRGYARRAPARRVSSYSARRGRSSGRASYGRSRRRSTGREIRIVVEQRNAAPVMPVGVTDAGPPPRARF